MPRRRPTPVAMKRRRLKMDTFGLHFRLTFIVDHSLYCTASLLEGAISIFIKNNIAN
jgi:hypothetical protein